MYSGRELSGDTESPAARPQAEGDAEAVPTWGAQPPLGVSQTRSQ